MTATSHEVPLAPPTDDADERGSIDDFIENDDEVEEDGEWAPTDGTEEENSEDDEEEEEDEASDEDTADVHEQEPGALDDGIDEKDSLPNPNGRRYGPPRNNRGMHSPRYEEEFWDKEVCDLLLAGVPESEMDAALSDNGSAVDSDDSFSDEEAEWEEDCDDDSIESSVVEAPPKKTTPTTIKADALTEMGSPSVGTKRAVPTAVTAVKKRTKKASGAIVPAAPEVAAA